MTDMRALLLGLFLVIGCGNPEPTAADKCAAGAKSVDGVVCCDYLFTAGPTSCNEGDQCLHDPTISGTCLCANHQWLCGDPPFRRDLSVPESD